MRVCAEPGCPTLTTGRRCPACSAQHERDRGTHTQRGYDSVHERERARWKQILDIKAWPCARCTRPIEPGQAWDLGHDDNDRARWTGPECIPCNRATRGRRQ